MSETAGGCVYDGVPLDGVRCGSTPTAASCSAARHWPTAIATHPMFDPFAEPGWFRTDDIGAVDDSGALSVLGRADEAISTGGLTVLPQPVEAALRTHPAVADSRCSGWTTNDWADGWSPPSWWPTVVSRLRSTRYGRTSCAPWTAPPRRELHIVDALPMRGIGKVDRQALARLCQRG